MVSLTLPLTILPSWIGISFRIKVVVVVSFTQLDGILLHLIGLRAEGGLSIKNLCHFKITLMSKNVFAVFNFDTKLWVQIFILKYGPFKIWNPQKFSKSSWFYKSLCKVATDIRVDLWMDSCNIFYTDFWLDPWCYEMSLALKPSFLDMHEMADTMSIVDLTEDDHLNYNAMCDYFGEHFVWSRLPKLQFGDSVTNHWVWMPTSPKTKIVSATYYHLNRSCYLHESWNGWREVWRLHTTPRVKFMGWKMLHCETPIYAFLYRLNVG